MHDRVPADCPAYGDAIRSATSLVAAGIGKIAPPRGLGGSGFGLGPDPRRTSLRQGIPASQLVRAVTLAAAEERLDRPAGAAIPPGYLALIEDVYRGV